MRIVLAVDGSPMAARAARHVAKLAARFKAPPKIVLLTVDPPMMPGVERKIGKATVQKIHEANTDEALRDARAILDKAGVAYEERRIVGEVAPSIIEACGKAPCDLLVMGSRGRGALKSAVLGSVALKILAGSKVPVTLVR
jgi:nucleotide-binding universal stress UspA family protein